jgi:phosphonate transport system substrate-binding protein
VILLLIVFGNGTLSHAYGSSKDALRLGVFPYLSPTRMDDIFSPVSQKLARGLQQPVRFRTSSNLPRFKQNLLSGDYDIVIAQPILYPLAVDQLGYLPLIRMEESISSVVLVLQDSPYRSVQDLQGRTIATPPVNGPVVLLAKKHFSEQGIDPDSAFEFVPNKTAGTCMQKVLARRVEACIAPHFAVRPFERSMGVRLRILQRTRGIPNRAVLVHPRVPENLRQQIRNTMLSWKFSNEGRELLRSIDASGFVDLDDHEYDVVRNLIKDQDD